MTKMTTHERVRRMFEHREADRVPITDIPWGATLERWHNEGLPADVHFTDFFDIDHFTGINVNTTPRYPVRVLEETDEYTISTTPWGVTNKTWKHAASTPEYLDYTVVDRKSWAEAKARMTPSKDRVNWQHLEKAYPEWRKRGDWIEGCGWFGFDVAHSWMMGTERMLEAMMVDPEWVVDIFEHYLHMSLSMLDMVWDAGYEFDALAWPDDMGYKFNQFFSVDTYRALLKPIHKKAVEWAHAKGIKAEMHSCGDIRPFVPELIDIGMDGLNPLEVKAGVDPVELKKKYGNDILFHGGINALLYDDFEKLEAQVREVVPKMKENGGYIFSSDHSVPSSVSVDKFRQLVNLAKQIGSY